MIVQHLLGWRFEGRKALEPVVDNGQVVHGVNGEPKLEEMTQLHFVHAEGSPFEHRIIVSLNDDARKTLVAMLTGVQVAQPGDIGKVH